MFTNKLKSSKILLKSAHNRRLGVILSGLGASGRVLERLGASWRRLGGVLEVSWGRLEGVMGYLGAVLKASWGVLDVLGASGSVLGMS